MTSSALSHIESPTSAHSICSEYSSFSIHKVYDYGDILTRRAVNAWYFSTYFKGHSNLDRGMNCVIELFNQ